MLYNKRQFTKYNEKKLLRKVGKHWVTVSLSLLAMIGGGSMLASTVSAENVNHSDNVKAVSQADENRLSLNHQNEAAGNKRISTDKVVANNGASTNNSSYISRHPSVVNRSHHDSYPQPSYSHLLNAYKLEVRLTTYDGRTVNYMLMGQPGHTITMPNGRQVKFVKANNGHGYLESVAGRPLTNDEYHNLSKDKIPQAFYDNKKNQQKYNINPLLRFIYRNTGQPVKNYLNEANSKGYLPTNLSGQFLGFPGEVINIPVSQFDGKGSYRHFKPDSGVKTLPVVLGEGLNPNPNDINHNYWPKGDTLNMYTNKTYAHIKFTYNGHTVDSVNTDGVPGDDIDLIKKFNAQKFGNNNECNLSDYFNPIPEKITANDPHNSNAKGLNNGTNAHLQSDDTDPKHPEDITVPLNPRDYWIRVPVNIINHDTHHGHMANGKSEHDSKDGGSDYAPSTPGYTWFYGHLGSNQEFHISRNNIAANPGHDDPLNDRNLISGGRYHLVIGINKNGQLDPNNYYWTTGNAVNTNFASNPVTNGKIKVYYTDYADPSIYSLWPRIQFDFRKWTADRRDTNDEKKYNNFIENNNNITSDLNEILDNDDFVNQNYENLNEDNAVNYAHYYDNVSTPESSPVGSIVQMNPWNDANFKGEDSNNPRNDWYFQVTRDNGIRMVKPKDATHLSAELNGKPVLIQFDGPVEDTQHDNYYATKENGLNGYWINPRNIKGKGGVIQANQNYRPDYNTVFLPEGSTLMEYTDSSGRHYYCAYSTAEKGYYVPDGKDNPLVSFTHINRSLQDVGNSTYYAGSMNEFAQPKTYKINLMNSGNYMTVDGQIDKAQSYNSSTDDNRLKRNDLNVASSDHLNTSATGYAGDVIALNSMDPNAPESPQGNLNLYPVNDQKHPIKLLSIPKGRRLDPTFQTPYINDIYSQNTQTNPDVNAPQSDTIWELGTSGSMNPSGPRGETDTIDLYTADNQVRSTSTVNFIGAVDGETIPSKYAGKRTVLLSPSKSKHYTFDLASYLRSVGNPIQTIHDSVSSINPRGKVTLRLKEPLNDNNQKTVYITYISSPAVNYPNSMTDVFVTDFDPYSPRSIGTQGTVNIHYVTPSGNGEFKDLGHSVRVTGGYWSDTINDKLNAKSLWDYNQAGYHELGIKAGNVTPGTTDYGETNSLNDDYGSELLSKNNRVFRTIPDVTIVVAKNPSVQPYYVDYADLDRSGRPTVKLLGKSFPINVPADHHNKVRIAYNQVDNQVDNQGDRLKDYQPVDTSLSNSKNLPSHITADLTQPKTYPIYVTAPGVQIHYQWLGDDKDIPYSKVITLDNPMPGTPLDLSNYYSDQSKSQIDNYIGVHHTEPNQDYEYVYGLGDVNSFDTRLHNVYIKLTPINKVTINYVDEDDHKDIQKKNGLYKTDVAQYDHTYTVYKNEPDKNVDYASEDFDNDGPLSGYNVDYVRTSSHLQIQGNDKGHKSLKPLTLSYQNKPQTYTVWLRQKQHQRTNSSAETETVTYSLASDLSGTSIDTAGVSLPASYSNTVRYNQYETSDVKDTYDQKTEWSAVSGHFSDVATPSISGWHADISKVAAPSISNSNSSNSAVLSANAPLNYQVTYYPDSFTQSAEAANDVDYYYADDPNSFSSSADVISFNRKMIWSSGASADNYSSTSWEADSSSIFNSISYPSDVNRRVSDGSNYDYSLSASNLNHLSQPSSASQITSQIISSLEPNQTVNYYNDLVYASTFTSNVNQTLNVDYIIYYRLGGTVASSADERVEYTRPGVWSGDIDSFTPAGNWSAASSFSVPASYYSSAGWSPVSSSNVDSDPRVDLAGDSQLDSTEVISGVVDYAPDVNQVSHKATEEVDYVFNGNPSLNRTSSTSLAYSRSAEFNSNGVADNASYGSWSYSGSSFASVSSLSKFGWRQTSTSGSLPSSIASGTNAAYKEVIYYTSDAVQTNQSSETETITYSLNDDIDGTRISTSGVSLPSNYLNTVHYSQSEATDNGRNDGETQWSAASGQSFSDVVTPSISGWHADISEVRAPQISNSNSNGNIVLSADKPLSYVVTYYPDRFVQSAKATDDVGYYYTPYADYPDLFSSSADTLNFSRQMTWSSGAPASSYASTAWNAGSRTSFNSIAASPTNVSRSLDGSNYSYSLNSVNSSLPNAEQIASSLVPNSTASYSNELVYASTFASGINQNAYVDYVIYYCLNGTIASSADNRVKYTRSGIWNENTDDSSSMGNWSAASSFSVPSSYSSAGWSPVNSENIESTPQIDLSGLSPDSTEIISGIVNYAPDVDKDNHRATEEVDYVFNGDSSLDRSSSTAITYSRPTEFTSASADDPSYGSWSYSGSSFASLSMPSQAGWHYDSTSGSLPASIASGTNSAYKEVIYYTRDNISSYRVSEAAHEAINYLFSDNGHVFTSASYPDENSAAGFYREAYSDADTHQTTYGPWSAAGSFQNINAPSISGWQASPSMIAAPSISPNNCKDYRFTVVYRKAVGPRPKPAPTPSSGSNSVSGSSSSSSASSSSVNPLPPSSSSSSASSSGVNPLPPSSNSSSASSNSNSMPSSGAASSSTSSSGISSASNSSSGPSHHLNYAKPRHRRNTTKRISLKKRRNSSTSHRSRRESKIKTSRKHGTQALPQTGESRYSNRGLIAMIIASLGSFIASVRARKRKYHE